MMAPALQRVCVRTGGTHANPGPGPALGLHLHRAGHQSPDECVDIEQDIAIELDDIQSCTADADCGQVLVGTSCGCTRNLVARVDADISDFQALQQQAAELECDTGFVSVCDCPAAAGFRCDAGTCAWNYVSDYPYLPECRTADGDPLTVSGVKLEGDELVVDVSSSGGCVAHDYTLCWPAQAFAESEPVQAMLEIFHDDHDDECDSIVKETLRLSVAPLKEAYAESYQTKTGTIRIQLDKFSVDYTF